MKPLITLILLLFSFSCKASEIDELKTIGDVNNFMKRVAKKWDPSFFDVKPDTASKLSNANFLKLDINDDGRTDLILNGENIVAVVDNGMGDYVFHLINESGGMTFKRFVLIGVDLAKPAKIMVKVYYPHNPSGEPVVFDTLIVKYGGFVEYNKNIDDSPITKFSFSTTGCFGECPIFDLYIQADGTAEYDAYDYNPERGRFTGTIVAEKLKEIMSLMTYINLKNLNNDYKVNWTDDQGCTVKVNYKDGTEKTIHDYGEQGTFGLRQLYYLLFRLRKSQEWHKDEN